MATDSDTFGASDTRHDDGDATIMHKATSEEHQRWRQALQPDLRPSPQEAHKRYTPQAGQHSPRQRASRPLRRRSPPGPAFPPKGGQGHEEIRRYIRKGIVRLRGRLHAPRGYRKSTCTIKGQGRNEGSCGKEGHPTFRLAPLCRLAQIRADV